MILRIIRVKILVVSRLTHSLDPKRLEVEFVRRMRPAIALLQIPSVKTVILRPVCLGGLAAPRAFTAEGPVVPTAALLRLLVVAKLIDIVNGGAGAGAPRDELAPTEDTLPLRVMRRVHFG